MMQSPILLSPLFPLPPLPPSPERAAFTVQSVKLIDRPSGANIIVGPAASRGDGQTRHKGKPPKRRKGAGNRGENSQTQVLTVRYIQFKIVARRWIVSLAAGPPVTK
jgi:hypothetical protein